MDQKREELGGGKMEMGQAGLDLGVEVFGQEPEGMRFFQAPALALLRDPVQMLWGLAGEGDTGREREQVAQQIVEEQVAGAIAEGVDPLAHGGRRRPILGQLAHQPSPAKADEQVEGDHLLQESDDKAAMGMKKVRQQGVGAPARFAADALDNQPVVGFPGNGHARVGAPTNQGAGGPAVGMRALLGEREHGLCALACSDVFFDGAGKTLYNDHGFGDTPLSWSGRQAQTTRWGVSSFLAGLAAIILVVIGSVKRRPLQGPRRGRLVCRHYCSLNAAGSAQTPGGGSGVIILLGQDQLYSDQIIWPVTLCQGVNGRLLSDQRP
jgi:hypothetical protein